MGGAGKETEEKQAKGRVTIHAEGISRKYTKQVSMGSRMLNSTVHKLYVSHSPLVLLLKLKLSFAVTLGYYCYVRIKGRES